MKYKHINYVNEEGYSHIKKSHDPKKCILVEIDGKDIQDDKYYYLSRLFKKTVSMPHHYFGNIDALYDIPYDFFEFNTKKEMIVLIKNYLGIKDKEPLNML